MATSIDLSGQDDVYSNVRPDYQTTSNTGFLEIRVVSDAMPTALARVFGLLSTMGIVPFSTSSSLGNEDTVRLDISLTGINPLSSDLLLRKIGQLTETISVSC